jgi:hypothetical protein
MVLSNEDLRGKLDSKERGLWEIWKRYGGNKDTAFLNILVARYEINPTESAMWEIWKYCECWGHTLPEAIRKRMYDLADSKIVDNEPGQLRNVLRKMCFMLVDKMVAQGMVITDAIEIIAKTLEHEGAPFYKDDAINEESIRRAYYRWRKQDL